jgi:hypothetical protein
LISLDFLSQVSERGWPYCFLHSAQETRLVPASAPPHDPRRNGDGCG